MRVGDAGFLFKRTFCVPTASLPIDPFRYGGSALPPASTATAIVANTCNPSMYDFRTVVAVAFRAETMLQGQGVHSTANASHAAGLRARYEHTYCAN